MLKKPWHLWLTSTYRYINHIKPLKLGTSNNIHSLPHYVVMLLNPAFGLDLGHLSIVK